MTTSLSRVKRDRGLLALAFVTLPFVASPLLDGCSSNSNAGGAAGAAGSGAATCAAPGGPESGPADTHCEGDGGPIVQATGTCQTPTGPVATDYGPPIFNTSGSDDDCKYDVSYTVNPICENAGVTFSVTVKKRTPDQSPLTGAKPFAEATIGTHAAPPSGQTTIEQTGGVYQIGPIKFDQPGEWTVRFHFFEECADAVDSPHGHVAFLVTVP